MPINSSFAEFLSESLTNFNDHLYTKYSESLALLSKNIFDSGESLHYIYRDIHDQIEDIDVWILGANFNDTTKIDAKKSLKCGYYTCYEKSLENGKICKPGRFIFLVFFK